MRVRPVADAVVMDAVAKHFRWPLRTASLYVKRARDAGLLEKEAGHGQD